MPTCGSRPRVSPTVSVTPPAACGPGTTLTTPSPAGPPPRPRRTGSTPCGGWTTPPPDPGSRRRHCSSSRTPARRSPTPSQDVDIPGHDQPMSNAAARRLPFDAALRTRADFQRAVTGLCEPFADAEPFERQLEGLGQPCAHYGPQVARLELTARLLWGLAPLTAGGGRYRGWPQLRAAVTAGTDPGH